MFKRRTVDKRLVNALEGEVAKLQTRGQPAEAAETYERLAAAYLEDNVLIYADYCHSAFRMWLKAKEIEQALRTAHDVLRVLDDAGWLKKSMERVLDLKQMIDELKAGGYGLEAEEFAKALDDKLAEFGLMLRPVKSGTFPATCPACGAPLPVADGETEIKCPSCGQITRPS
jgi:rubrerythrin